MAEEINVKKLAQINSKQCNFKSIIEGEFSTDSLPTEIELKLKVGAQIMFLANDSQKKWVNGTIATITNINKKIIKAKILNGKEVKIFQHTWEIFKYKYNSEKKTIEKETVGTFTQYPIKLAWAITIHKSQGKTFDKIIIDIGNGTFTHGQMYVALSRCRTIDGIKLKTQIKKQHIWLDWRIVKFLTRFQYQQSTKQTPNKKQLIQQAIQKKQKIEIIYLKPNNEKSNRTITPIEIKQMEYLGHEFEGLEAYCHTRKDKRTFKIERIIEIKTTK